MSRIRPAEGWMSLILLTLMLLTVAWSIESAKWAEGLALLQGVVLLAIVVGFVFAELQIPGLVAHTIGTVAGMAWSAILVGRLLDPASVTHRLILDDQALTWRIRFTELAHRIQSFVEIARSGNAGNDNLVFILQMAAIIWLVGYSSTWFLFRIRSVWGAIVPSGFAILLNLYYAPPDLYVWMAVYLLCALLLIVRSNVFLQKAEWRQAGVSFSPDISYDFLFQGAIFAVIVILLAWLAPTTKAAPRLYSFVEHFDEPVYRFQREFNRLYSSLNYRPQPGPAYFADTMTLSGAVNLGDTPIFDAVTDDGRYWRGVVYDQYTGRGWVNTATSITTLDDEDQRLTALDYKLRQPVTQTIRVLQPGMTQLHTLPQPIDVDVPSRAQFSEIPETTESGVRPLNVSMLQSRRPLKTGETYTAVSSVSVADVESLRNAGTNYPAWIERKYLQLPDDLPQRVRDLAEEIAAGKENPYDQMAAIEAHLRQIQYDEKIPAPPASVDSVDWFLFEQQAGYCDYYASSLVVMARSLGIPARIAAGYSIGDYDPEIAAYRQYEYDAHSWPEVFFPEYGWVEFEPTAADPTIVRPSAPRTVEATDESSEDESTNAQQDRELDEEMILQDRLLGDDPGLLSLQQGARSLWVWAAIGLLGVLMLAAAVGGLLWQRAFRGLSPAGATYARMTRLASWLGLRVDPSHTPNEYADLVAEAVPESRSAVARIVDAYVVELFAEVSPDERDASALRQAWLNLRHALVRRIGAQLLHRVTRQTSH